MKRDRYDLPVRFAGVALTAEVIYAGDEFLIGHELLKHFVVTLDYPAGTVTLAPP